MSTKTYTPDSPKFPGITVRLSGRNGNAYAIMGSVIRAMRKHGCTQEEIDAYRAESRAGDFDNLLQVAMCTVDVQ